MTQDPDPTCGQGLAQHADLPRLVGGLMESVAETLTAHLGGLTSGDPETQGEKRVYQQLATRHREVAATLDTLAEEMAGHQDMPMGEHDIDALSSREATDALAGMIEAEAKLLTLVQQQLTEHKAMLGEMGSPG
jgi:hypothetical protein